MKKILFFILAFLITLSVSAQKQKVEVQLKNGTVIKGRIIESNSPNNIRIKSKSSLRVIQKNEIDTIYSSKYEPNFKAVSIPYFIKIDIGILSGNSKNDDSEPTFFHSSYNYEVKKKLYAGAGIGVEYYMEQSYIPVFANFEYRLRQTKFSPMLYLKTGYLIPGEKQHPSSIYEQQESRNIPPRFLNASGGFIVNPGFGFTSMVGENFGICFSVGYRYHALNFTGKKEYELEYKYNRLSLSLSIIFK